MKERGWKIVAGAAGMPPHNSEEWGDYRGKWCKRERGSDDSERHWNTALVAAIQRYAGLARSGQLRGAAMLTLGFGTAGDRCEEDGDANGNKKAKLKPVQ